MATEILMGDAEDSFELSETPAAPQDPDEFFAKNAFRIVYQTNNFFLPQLSDLITNGDVINIRPEYQRRLVWSTAQKSRLIESLLLNIPIPPIYLYENQAARYEVMDGQQRLNAVREYFAGDFALTGLQVLQPLNNLRFSRCPPRIKRALDRASISAIVLLLESDTDGMTDMRRFIFDRLNTGGKKLNPQEIRNALNPGPFNKAIINVSRYGRFTEVFDIPPYVEADPTEYYENPTRQKNALYASMGDCQLVLRYFALKDDTNIRGSMKSILDRAMEAKITESEAHQLETEFQERFEFLYALFAKKPFQLEPDEKGNVRVSAAIYDAAMVAIDRNWAHRSDILKDQENVLSRMRQALKSDDEMRVLTGQRNTAQAIKERISLMSKIMRPV